MWGAGFATSKGVEPRWTGKVALIPDQLDWPLRWRGSKKAKAEGRPSRIFVNSTSDLFHEKLSDEDIDKVFAVMALAPQHTFQVLTKRAERMRAYFNGPYPDGNGVAARIAEATLALAPSRAQLPNPPTIIEMPIGPRLPNGEPEFGFRRMFNLKAWPLANVWLGVSTENQETANERIPHLLKTPAAVRFISAEPLIGPIDLRHFVNVFPVLTKPLYAETGNFGGSTMHWERTKRMSGEVLRSDLDWVIAGGESGADARAPQPDWFRQMRDQCAAAGVPYFFKQWGEWAPGSMVMRGGRYVDEDSMARSGKGDAGHSLDGRTHREFPRA